MKTYAIDDRKPSYVVTPDGSAFAHEYAMAGWFRWKEVEKQDPWHLMFRLTMNDVNTNKNADVLGDRVLSAWLGKDGGGVIALSTYSYLDMNAKGNPNVHQLLPHKDEHLAWHHVYFGYDRKSRSAFAAIRFRSGRV